jgi:C4-dicarboxylate transporter DctM subunit
MDPIAWGAVIFGTALLFMLIGIPIWVALAGTGILFIFITAPENMNMAPRILFESLNDFTLLTIPLFVLMAEAIAQSKASEALFSSMQKWFSWLPGALGISNLIAAGLMGMVTGSGPAGAAAIGGVGIPQMRREGYPPAMAGALVAVGSTVVILIPPSIPMIIYGVVTETSVGKLFFAGLIPGFMLVFIQCAWVAFYYKFFIEKRRKQMLASQPAGEGAAPALLPIQSFTWKDRLLSLPMVLPFLFLAFVVLGSILLGWASPSEAAGVGAAISLLLVIAMFQGYRPQTLKNIFSLTITESSMILMIMAAALLFGYALSNVYATQALAEALMTLPLGKWGIFVIIDVFVILLSVFLPPAAIILLVGPLLVDVLVELGFDPIWYGVIMMLLMQIGLSMPTVGLNMLICKRMVKDCSMGQLFKASIPFLLAIILAVIILCILPQIAMWLPGLAIGTGE